MTPPRPLRGLAALKALREQALWSLLAAAKAPVFIGLLQSLLFDAEKTLPASILHEHLTQTLENMRDSGEDMPQSAQLYIADCLRQGWLTRRFPAGASEEEYALSVAAAEAIRFINTTLTPRSNATESRLASVIEQLLRLAEQTDVNPQTRIATSEILRNIGIGADHAMNAKVSISGQY